MNGSVEAGAAPLPGTPLSKTSKWGVSVRTASEAGAAASSPRPWMSRPSEPCSVEDAAAEAKRLDEKLGEIQEASSQETAQGSSHEIARAFSVPTTPPPADLRVADLGRAKKTAPSLRSMVGIVMQESKWRKGPSIAETSRLLVSAAKMVRDGMFDETKVGAPPPPPPILHPQQPHPPTPHP